MDDLQIYIRRTDTGFSVTVEPHQGEACEYSAADHRGAYGFAAGLRMTHRWPIVDQAAGGVNG